MPKFAIEARRRASARDRTLEAWYTVDAEIEQNAVSEAMRRFQTYNPDKDLSDYSFDVVRIGGCASGPASRRTNRERHMQFVRSLTERARTPHC